MSSFLLPFEIQSFDSSSKQGLIFRGSDDSLLDKLVMLIGERLNECIEGWHPPIRNCKISGMKVGHKNRVVWAKFQKDGKYELIIFLLKFTLLQLEHQVLKLGKEVIHGVKVAWV